MGAKFPRQDDEGGEGGRERDGEGGRGGSGGERGRGVGWGVGGVEWSGVEWSGVGVVGAVGSGRSWRRRRLEVKVGEQLVYPHASYRILLPVVRIIFQKHALQHPECTGGRHFSCCATSCLTVYFCRESLCVSSSTWVAL